MSYHTPNERERLLIDLDSRMKIAAKVTRTSVAYAEKPMKQATVATM